jgi:2-polyprenyl-3-methyl-5-hydroxy-6-metoxy-1,4-benzoquinol methylase
MPSTESEHLERIAADSWYGRGLNARTIEYCFRIFTRYLRGGSILELGPAEGLMTALLTQIAGQLTVVDGAAKFCQDLARRFPGVRVVHALFEEFRAEREFDSIVLGHVLEHVQDPVTILRLVGAWLKPSGRVLAAVPNSRSLHRQAAVIMRLLPAEDGLNETDIHHGHRRVFCPETFRNVFIQAGLDIEVFGGYWIKPLSNNQIEETWNQQMLDAFMQLGERYPDIAAEIYVVAKQGTQS